MFRDNLKEQIEYKGLLIKELSAKTGISKRTIDTYVDSRAVIPSAEVAVRLAQALDTSVEYLVTGREAAPVESRSSTEEAANLKLLRKHKNLILELDSLSPQLLEIVSAMIHTAVRTSR